LREACNRFEAMIRCSWRPSPRHQRSNVFAKFSFLPTGIPKTRCR
jgi:hypothetical protein